MNNTMNWIKNNVPSILSVLAAGGVVTTAVLAAKGHKDACDILNCYEFPEDMDPRERLMEMTRLTYKSYAPAVVSGAATIGFIFGSNRMHMKKEAALVGVLGVVGARLKEMDKEVLKRYGKESLDEIRHDILEREVDDAAEDKMRAEKKKHRDVDELYYEPFTEQFFWASQEEIKDAELHLNQEFQDTGMVRLYDFIDMLPRRCNLKKPAFTTQMGWYAGDDAFEWNASFTGYFISLNPAMMEHTDAKVIQYSIYPSEPSDDYIEIMTGAKPPYIYGAKHIEPGDQLETEAEEQYRLMMAR